MSDDRLEPTLQELVDNTNLKWIFVGGKGGVGKTTSSCSLAVTLARRRESVLILSTDPAHNLSDAFGQKVGSQPSKVVGFDNLFAMELQTKKTSAADFALPESQNPNVEGDIFQQLQSFVPELVQSIPGIDEALGFAELINSIQSMEFSVIVFDTAPTGHTLRLLGFPELMEKAFVKLGELASSMGGAMDMMKMMNPGMDGNFMGKFDDLRAQTTAVRERFQNPAETTFLCVCIPEFLSVYETERLVVELSKKKIDVSNVIVNQVLFPLEEVLPGVESLRIPTLQDRSDPDVERLLQVIAATRERLTAFEENFLCRRRMQSKYLAQIEDLYAYDFHVVCMPLLSDEVRGIPALEKFGASTLVARELPLIEETQAPLLIGLADDE
ncbi:MAG: hypothetical protein KVP17_000289 [Porospora cf. gigantea B]|uniref:uncharacterized protein n=1 Tax=Porospora cf. gigantea B TaxID=2853592 RepID=UPI003571D6D6|nr:MAG: hypothetical protein KVP17_000289 [Porospora cf. gigantea B]